MVKIKKYLAGVIIIPILLIYDKTIMSLSYKDQVFLLVNITIINLDAKIYQRQNWLGTLFLSLISILYEQAKDFNNKNRDSKAKTYYLI